MYLGTNVITGVMSSRERKNIAKETEEKLKEILGEGVTLGMDSAEEDWESDGEKPQDSSGVDSWE